jgi:hypothetical protein
MNKPPRKQLGNNMQCYFCGSGWCCKELKCGENTFVYLCESCYPLSAKVGDFVTTAGALLGGGILSAVGLAAGVGIFVSAYGLTESWVKGILGLPDGLLMMLLAGVITVCEFVGGLFLVLFLFYPLSILLSWWERIKRK